MDQLIKDLNGPDETDRIYAAQDLGETQNPAAAPPLLARLSAENSQAVRDAVVFALKSLPCESVYEDLLALFHSPDPYLRNAAIDIFGAGGADAVPFLVSKADNEDGEVRKLILDALYAATAPEALEPIRRHLEDPAVNVRITAVEYLGRLEDRESLDRMLDMLRDEDEPMLRIALLETILLVAERRRDIRTALSHLAPDNNFTAAVPFYLPQAIRLAAMTGDPDMVTAVADALPERGFGSIYGEDIVHALEQASRKYPDLLLSAAVRKVLERILSDDPESAVRDLCSALLSC